VEDADLAEKVGCITSILAFHFQHSAPPCVAIIESHRKIKNQPASGEEGIEPNSARVCHAGVDEDRIAGAGVVLYPVAMRYLGLPEVFKVLTGARGKVNINLDAHDLAGSSYDFSHDRCVITDAASHVQYAIALVKVEGINTEGKVARLPIV
jgi:hypothetical protein